ncbi:hypothetical protein KAFR_0B01480 [Kazachstania africana CBS 2517]|uniref:Uncharacterized protein n=1 Tax=Kazachstania africana (strain ATCC 22294 / BCRC 22015 / CBS 2517 / CECT 1963 / NBRC 1671 / NRRL Y-8276) TaxID=1071382 RepID=H2APZ7_KAZAF|nr:hypothetical protein KAFR_0B01480 [Kazachstania africana CBS 2517]CCF56447.1 hypothetical protein KAFR_0B01480 [Kazachstania africana CBS 2517]
MSSEEEFHTAQSDEEIADSQDSDPITGSPTKKNQIINFEDDKFLDSSSDLSSSNETDLDSDLELAVLKPKSKKFRPNDADYRSKSDVDTKNEFITVKQFDLGGSFDSTINEQHSKLQRASSLLKISPGRGKQAIQTTSKQEVDTIRKKLFECVKNKNVTDNIVEIIASEHISDRYKDWFFITANCNNDNSYFPTHYSNINDLMRSFGVEEGKLEANMRFHDDDISQFDSFAWILPIEEMIARFDSFLKKNSLSPENFAHVVKIFICFILDRNVFCSNEFLLKNWCNRVYFRLILKKFLDNDNNAFIKIYNSLFDLQKKRYFLLYRLTRLLPHLKNFFVYSMFKHDVNEIINEFNNLFDSKRYTKNFYYFLLFVYGSDRLPYGVTRATTYFKDCISDMSNNSAGEVELSLLNGLLNMFIKFNTGETKNGNAGRNCEANADMSYDFI